MDVADNIDVGGQGVHDLAFVQFHMIGVIQELEAGRTDDAQHFGAHLSGFQEVADMVGQHVKGFQIHVDLVFFRHLGAVLQGCRTLRTA